MMDVNESENSVQAGQTGTEMLEHEAAAAEPAAEGETTPVVTADGQPKPDAVVTPGDFAADQFALKFRGRTILPKTRDEVVNWAQLGYNYDHRNKALTEKEGQIAAKEKELDQYIQLSKMFDERPDFKQRVLEIYNELRNGAVAAGQQTPTADGELPPQIKQYISGLEQKVQQMESRFKSYDEKQANSEVENEIAQLRKDYPDEEWDAQDEKTGKTLVRELLEHAHQNGFHSLKAAYRDYMWDAREAKVRANALKQASEQERRNAKAGIVSDGGNGSQGAKQRVLHPSKLSYDDLAREALAQWEKA